MGKKHSDEFLALKDTIEADYIGRGCPVFPATYMWFYMNYDGIKTVLYVGSARNLANRLAWHTMHIMDLEGDTEATERKYQMARDYIEDGFKIWYEMISGPLEISQLKTEEKRAIDFFNPPLNTKDPLTGRRLIRS